MIKTSKYYQSEEFLLNVINSISDPIFVKDENHRWVLLNNSFCIFVGHKKEEMLGKSDYDIFPKEQADIFWQKDDEVLKSEKTNTNEETITDSKGEMRIIVTKKSVYTKHLGEKYIVGVIRNITEIKKVEMSNRTHMVEFEKLNRIMMGREQKMIELKNEIEILKERLKKCDKNMLL